MLLHGRTAGSDQPWRDADRMTEKVSWISRKYIIINLPKPMHLLECGIKSRSKSLRLPKIWLLELGLFPL